MIFRITDRIRIRGLDSRNWVVEELRTADPNNPLTKYPGRETWKALGYHRSLEIAGRQLLEVTGKLEDGEHDWRDVEAWIDTASRCIAEALGRAAQDRAA